MPEFCPGEYDYDVFPEYYNGHILKPEYQAELDKERYEAMLASEELSDTKPKREPVVGLESGLRGEAESRPRVTVRIERRSTRLLDPDNLYGSVKALVDCLRASKLISDDDSQSISLVVTQSKVKTRKEHETIIELDYET
jgi:hypothetical protein